jgi:flavin reductase (DIM6/NTAB) family NADH-FMN oxidoreductase RutF
MQRSDIPFEKFRVPPVHLWDRQWLILAAGSFTPGGFNFMTVGWGGFGVMWKKPLAMVVVRPVRHTWQFMEASETFTLSAFPEQYRRKLSWCGAYSGRDHDKVKESGFTPIASRFAEAPGFQEAELIIECRKSYFQDLDPAHFLDPATEENYPKKDYHRMYFGEILAVAGTDAWRDPS